MEIIEVTAAEFKNILPKTYHVFGSAEFTELNADKSDEVFFLLFREGKYRLGITGGVKGGEFLSPFSAPFGGFVFTQEEVRIRMMDDALVSFSEWAKGKKFNSIRITLPPTPYHESFISKQVNSLFRNGFTVSKTDLNYSFDPDRFDKNYTANIWRNARKNLTIAFENNLKFLSCTTPEEKKTAYEIIHKNRESRGFPLRMSYDQVVLTSRILPADFFLVETAGQTPIASAVVFHVADPIVQVIYWGDLPEFGNLKTMNFLSYHLFQYYKEKGVKMIDIGPSTENSVPNHGLCEFKESIGCGISLKFSFTKELG